MKIFGVILSLFFCGFMIASMSYADSWAQDRSGFNDSIRIISDVAYGNDDKQRMDIYIPKMVQNAPVIFMVHGGGWRTGSKSSAGVVDEKVQYWLARGYIFISTDYRLLPEANPLEQADDIAKALAIAQKKVGDLKGKPDKFVLMGHSAGAHLVALLTANPEMAFKYGAKAWRGTVALDSAAYDVPEIMNNRHFGLYDKAFGTDEKFWREVSPFYQIDKKPEIDKKIVPMLLVCSTLRKDACNQARSFAHKAQSLGSNINILPIAKAHMEINRDLGKPGDYTENVNSFIDSIIR